MWITDTHWLHPRIFGESSVKRLCFLASLAALSWLAMQAVHEFGHVVGAWLSGGTIVDVDLHPLHISQTIVRPNPHPVLVVWSGPVLGCVIPLLIWSAFRISRSRAEVMFRFFSGFCLIANGLYLGTGVVDPVGDAFDLVQLEVPIWVLGSFGIIAAGLGLLMCSNLTIYLGLRRDSPPVSTRLMLGAILALLLTTLFEWLLNAGS
jgi:hypothetical protein